MSQFGYQVLGFGGRTPAVAAAFNVETINTTANLEARTGDAEGFLAYDKDTGKIYVAYGNNMWSKHTSDHAPTISNNYSMAFDGSNEYIDIGDASPANFAHTDPFTFSIWLKTSHTGFILPFAKSDSGGTTGYYCYLNYPTGYISLHFGAAYSSNMIAVKALKDNLTDDDWHHVAITYDGSTNASGMLIYIDGTARTPVTIFDTLSSSPVDSSPLYIGARYSASYDFVGNLDEFAIFDAELSATNISAIYSAGSSFFTTAYPGASPGDLRTNGGSYTAAGDLVGWWRLGDGTEAGAGATIYDMSTNSNNGAVTNTPTFETDAP